jgi:hypothetical protein
MTGWIILIAVMAILVILSLIRLGGRALYGPEGFSAYLIVGPGKIQLLPSVAKENKREKKPKKEKKPKQKHAAEYEGTEQQEEQPGTVGRVLKLLPVVAEAAGALKRKIRIDHLTMTVIWGAQDAASAAIGYGKANALLGMIWPLLDNNFRVKKCDWHVDVDYGEASPRFTADAAITISVGQLILFAVLYGVKLIMNWNRSGKAPRGNRRHKV